MYDVFTLLGFGEMIVAGFAFGFGFAVAGRVVGWVFDRSAKGA